MWLLYVTFEDFVCTHHPSRSRELISTSIDIDNYLKPRSLHWNSENSIQCSISNTEGRETLSENQDEVTSIAEPNGPSERKRVRSEAQENSKQPGLFAQTDKDSSFCFVDNVIVSYRFAKKLHISSLYSHQNNVFRTIRVPNGVKHTVTMALSRPDRRARSADKMRGYNAQTTKQKLRDFKSSHCAVRDKLGYSQEVSASFGNHQRDGRVKDCVSRVKHTAKHTQDNSRYNPDLPGTNKCANKGDVILRSNCTGHEERLSTPKSNPRGQRKTHQPQKRTDNRNETQEKDSSSLINRINDLCWANDGIEAIPGHTDAPVNIPPQRPTVLFNDKDRSLGDLKRSNDLVSPQSDTTITPDSSRCPKRHCLLPPNHDDSALLSPDSGLDRTRSLSDSFDQVMSTGSQFDDPVQSANDGTAHAHSSDSSPMTISSGYESDSLPTCEADIDKIFVKRNKHKTKSSTTEPTTDYFSFSETYPPNLNASVSDMGYKPQQPPKVIVTRVPEKVLPHSSSVSNTRLIDNDNTISVPDKSSVRNIRATEGNFQCQLPLKPRRQVIQETIDTRFSPVQRNNYQLTKVARSMFQIIHDLQVEKEAADKKKSRKVRRAPAFKGEVSPAVQTVGAEGQGTQDAPAVSESQISVQNSEQDEEQSCERKMSVENLTQHTGNENTKPVSVVPENNVVEPQKGPVNSSLPHQPGKFAIKRVLRRPLGSNPADFARDLPHSSSAVSYLQDDNTPGDTCAIPNSLPDMSRLQRLSPRVHTWNNNVSTPLSVHSNVQEPDRIPFTENGCSPYATTRLPGCCTPKRDDRMDDHVYETIPGDEYLYAEFLRLRELGLLPKRLNRIPDHPGHVIPFHPPALPKRNHDNTPNGRPISARERSKRPPVPPFSQSRCVRQPLTDSPRPHAMMRSFSWEGQNAFDPDMSTHSVPDKYLTNPGRRSDAGISQNWAPGDEFNYVEGIRQPPPKRRENFYLLLQNKQKRAEISQSLEIETKLKELGLVFDERFKGRQNVDSDGYTKIDDDLLPLEHPRDRGQVFLKSTFV